MKKPVIILPKRQLSIQVKMRSGKMSAPWPGFKESLGHLV